ncbi:MAG: YnbE family lipoprotein [Gammaproteobacteria bacterium CG22_combo_CG10-13_8_21_14_all_40_8]|nr:MAG: YnbE family lipoprotein [Gammaproteobacteria bacterium CG22_combo_CG10-13_8_21_14_all_40_8]
MKFASGFILILLLSGCNPTIRVQVPDKPMEINLNITIDHRIRIEVEKELDNLLDKDSGLF